MSKVGKIIYFWDSPVKRKIKNIYDFPTRGMGQNETRNPN